MKLHWIIPTEKHLLFDAFPQFKHNVTKEFCAFGARGQVYQDGESTFAAIIYENAALGNKIKALMGLKGAFSSKDSPEFLIRGIPSSLIKKVGSLLKIPNDRVKAYIRF